MATLAEVAQIYRDTLSRSGTVVEFDISDLDRLGVPVTSCSLTVDGKIVHQGNGYGATADSAAVSGLGELAEGVVSAHGFRSLPIQIATRAELIRRLGHESVVDPRLLCLPAGCDYADDQRLSWVPMQRQRDGSSVQVPAAFVASDPTELRPGPGRSLIVPITNGLGAGLNSSRAVSHGIGELVQRHTNGLRFRALDHQSAVIDPAGLPPAVTALLTRFSAQGVQVHLKHAGTAFGMLSCYAVGVDERLDDPIRLTACGEAADSDPGTALMKAVLEYANSRARKAFCFGVNPRIRETAPEAYWDGLSTAGGEPRALEAMAEWAKLAPDELRELTLADLSRRVDLGDVAPAAARTYRSSTDRLLDQLDGHDVLVQQSQLGEVHAAKTVVTGLEVETLSYGRIGEAGCRSSLDADLDLVRVGPTPQNGHRQRVCLTLAAEERLGGRAWYSYERAAQIVGRLYPLYREPPRHAVAVGGPKPRR